MADHPGPFVESQHEEDILVLTILPAQIEGHEIAHRLREELLAAVEGAGVDHVVVDMRHTRYVSSVAFWPLLALRKTLKERDGRLIICGLDGLVGDVFYTTKMVDSTGTTEAPFEMAEDRAAALARLRGADETETS
jgi:anti-anti-sigma factor